MGWNIFCGNGLSRSNAPNLPQHHWHLNKQALIDADYLDTLPVPIKIKAHKNEKGYYQIDSYFFELVERG